MNARVSEDVLLAEIAAVIGEPARTRILLSLLDGHARTSTELAALAEVAPSTASAHLNRLRETRLIRVAAQGRHRYYSLRSRDVANVLEGLGVLAGRAAKQFVPSTPESLRKARSCYDHMAGRLAVVLHDQLHRQGWVISDPSNGPNAYKLSPIGGKRAQPLRNRYCAGTISPTQICICMYRLERATAAHCRRIGSCAPATHPREEMGGS